MSTFTTTVEGATLAEIHVRAKAETARFFEDTMVMAGGRSVEYHITPVAHIRDGGGGVTSLTYQAKVTVTW
jgi:hypothetical protein